MHAAPIQTRAGPDHQFVKHKRLRKPRPHPPPLFLHRSPISAPQSQPHLSSVTSRMQDDTMTWKSASTSGTASSKASSLFDLDEHGSKSILVYKYRSGAKGLEVKTEHELCSELDSGMLLLSRRVPSNTASRPQPPLHARHQENYTSRQQPVRHTGRGPHAS